MGEGGTSSGGIENCAEADATCFALFGTGTCLTARQSKRRQTCTGEGHCHPSHEEWEAEVYSHLRLLYRGDCWKWFRRNGGACQATSANVLGDWLSVILGCITREVPSHAVQDQGDGQRHKCWWNCCLLTVGGGGYEICGGLCVSKVWESVFHAGLCEDPESQNWTNDLRRLWNWSAWRIRKWRRNWQSWRPKQTKRCTVNTLHLLVLRSGGF